MKMISFLRAVSVGALLATVSPLLGQSPGEVVKDLHRLAKERKDDEIAKLLSPQFLTFLQQEELYWGRGKTFWLNWLTENRTLDKVEVSQEEIEGDQATVHYSASGADGNKSDKVLDVARINGRWLITRDEQRMAKRKEQRAESRAKLLLTALSKKDFKTVLNCCYWFQSELRTIEKDNPMALWEKIKNESIAAAEKKLGMAVTPGYEVSLVYPSELDGALRSLAKAMESSPEWRIVEIKEKDRGADYFEEHRHLWAAFIDMKFNDPKTSPLIADTWPKKIEDRRIRSGILELDFGFDDALLRSAGFVGAGNTYWEPAAVPSTTSSTPVAPQPQPPTAPGGLDASAVGLDKVCPKGTNGELRHGTKCTGYYGESGLVDIQPTGKSTAKEYVSTKGLVHAGIDLVAEEGSDVFAAADGIVDDIVSSDKDENFKSLGYMVIVEHKNKSGGKPTYSAYFHLKGKPLVGVGDAVMAGKTVLGKVGSTGSAFGAHLHMEVRHFAGRFSPQWKNIYGIERPKSDATYDEQDFKDNWVDPEQFASAKTVTAVAAASNSDGSVTASRQAAVAPAPQSIAADTSATPPVATVAALDTVQLLKDCQQFNKEGTTATTTFLKGIFDRKYLNQRVKYSGTLDKVSTSGQTITFKSTGDYPNKARVEALLAKSNAGAVSSLKSGMQVTIEGKITELQFPKGGIAGFGSGPSRTIQLTDATLISE